MSILPRLVTNIQSGSNANDLERRQIKKAKLSKAIDLFVIMMKRLKLFASPKEEV